MNIGKNKNFRLSGLFHIWNCRKDCGPHDWSLQEASAGGAADFQRDHTKLYSGLSFFTFVTLKSLENELNVFSYMPTT